MIIENPDAFKSWLTSILEPLCDADPAALAKYVYALVKKDKPLAELRDGMLDQLDVFLQHETKPFVDMLFKSLETLEYLKNDEKKLPTPPPEPLDDEKEPEINNHDEAVVSATPCPPVPVEPPALEEPRGRHRLVVTRAPRAPAPPISRAPPHEQTLVKVLPTELLEEPIDQPPRKRDRRADSLRDKDDRRRRRSHSRERRVRGRRYPRDDDRYDRRRLSPRPMSPSNRYRNRSPPSAIGDRQNSRSKSPVSVRDRDHERERDRLRVSREMERDRISRERDHRDRLSHSRDRERSRDRSRERSLDRFRDRSLSPRDSRPELNDMYKRRCIDFDEKGYCMRGDLCKYDHGSDPLVLEDAALTRVLTVPPPVPEYNPLAPDIWCGAPGFPPYPPPRLPPKELEPIPRIRHEVPVPIIRHPPPLHKKNFDYVRLGVPRPPPPTASGNCTLQVKKVPPGMNDITHLNNHFSKFGKIVNIQVCYEGDPEGALITFSNHMEANVAYKSTEAVLNNRFIKVFWHNSENKQENMPPSQTQQVHPKPIVDRTPGTRLVSQHKVLINRDNIKATTDNRQMEKAKEQAHAIQNGQELKKEVPSKPLEKSKQVMDMMKRAQALLETQLQQQMLLIEKFESGKVTGPQKAALLEAINSAQEGIEKLRKELFAYNGTLRQMQDEAVAKSMSRLQLQANAKRAKTREEFEKEILDADLDMMTKQQEGQDVTELKKKIDEMRRQRDLQFPPHPMVRRPHIISRGGRFSTMNRYVRGGAQKVFSVNQSVDHRPKALLISGFENDELEALITHFSQFGEVTNKEVNLAVPELVLQYKHRSHAELAAANGRHYNDRTLSITWVANTNKPLGASAAVEAAEQRPTPAPAPAPAPVPNGEAGDEHKEP
ncbi:hypothetical protein ACJJTC_019148, partial [Scirpophaga incertulas]